MRRNVVAPDGHEWSVSRKWLPRRPTWRGWKVPDDTDEAAFHALGELSGAMEGVLAGVVVAVIGIVLIALAVIFVFPLVVFVLDLFLVLLIATGLIALRVLFRRPWIIEAETKSSPTRRREWAVVGWRASTRTIAHVADELRRGRQPREIAPPRV